MKKMKHQITALNRILLHQLTSNQPNLKFKNIAFPKKTNYYNYNKIKKNFFFF